MTKQRLAYILKDLNRLYRLLPSLPNRTFLMAHPNPVDHIHLIHWTEEAVNKARHDLFAAVYKQRAIKDDPNGPWDTIKAQKAFVG